MLYVFHGSDAVTAKQKIRKLIDALLQKKPDALYFYFDDRSLDNEFLKGLFQSTGLFAEHHIIFLDRTFLSLESKDLIKDMQKSSHVFIVFEDGLDTKDLAYVQKHSDKSEVYEQKKIEKKDARKNIFSLTDALASRDKRRMWVLYRELLGEGVTPDEIQPMLFWQTKAMLQALEGKTPANAGLKPFVFTKSKRGAERYGREALRKLSSSLVQALYDSRQGKDLENELEKVLLSI